MNIFPITRNRYLWGLQARAPYALLLPWSVWQGVTPFSSERTPANSCVIGNGTPRSGTYLVNNILKNLGGWTNMGVHINPRMWDTWQREGKVTIHPCVADFAIKKLRNGQMAGAHLPWDKGLETTMAQATKERRIKHVFIHRDPRDAFISYLSWVTKSENFLTTAGGKEFRKFMLERFDDDDHRLSYIIEQPQHSCDVYMSYEPWLRSPNCFAVKFEEIYPELANLQNGVQGPVFSKLLNYLEVDVAGNDLGEFSRKVHGQSTTVIGRYKNVFKDQHYSQIDNSRFRNTLEALGYEW